MENTETVTATPAVETTVKSVENLDFLKDVTFTMGDKPPVADPAKTTPPTETPAGGTTPTATTETPAAETKETTTTQTTNTDTPADAGTPEDHFEIGDEELGPILSDATKGAIQDVSHLHAILEANKNMQERLQELEANPVGVFKDPQQAAIAKFLLDYKGGDFHTGIQTYAKLQSLDIPNMKAEEALLEDYVMNKSKAGISRTDAEAMFKIEFDEKYEKYGELADKFINADSFAAKTRLNDAKQTFTSEPKVDDQTAQKQQEFEQARERFEQSVERALKNEKGEEFKTLSITGLSENPEHDFNFEVTNKEVVEAAMYDYQGFFNSRYGTTDGGFNAEQLKQDLSLIHNFEQISQQLFEHGSIVGYEKAIMERTNTPNKNTPPASSVTGDPSIPQNWGEVQFQMHGKKPS